MIRLWGRLIKPVFEAAEARNVLEIGAEYGLSTRVLMNYINAVDGHLHCIDPSPLFEADDFRREYGERLTFYGDLSLNVIGQLPQLDVAMVDGDHNWYTVFNELKALEVLHGGDPMRQPIIFAHDIGWPYGRRDLYYDPTTIPEAFLQPYERKGMLPNKAHLVDEGGMNLELCNAVDEGGPKNGVLTGVEDYIAQSALDFRFLNLPFYYGLGILVTEQRLAANPALAAQISTLEQQLQGEELIRLAEHLRIVEGVVLQTLQRKLEASEQRVAELEAQLGETPQGGARQP